MGGDGGAKPLGRQFLRGVKKSKRKESFDKNEVTIAKHSTCALTNERLREPIVCCRLGYLFNKESLIERIIEKKVPKEFKHIKGIKDMKTLEFCPNPAFDNGKAVSDAKKYWSGSTSGRFICPVTRIEFNGRHRFCVVWPSGVVLSERCLKEIPRKELFEFAKAEFRTEDVIRLVPSADELKTMRVELKEWRIARKLEKKRLKKMKKRKRAAAAPESSFTRTAAISSAPSQCAEAEVVKTKRSKSKRSSDVGLRDSKSSLHRNASSASEEALKRIEGARKSSSVFASLFCKDPSKSRNVESDDGVDDRNNNLFIRR